MGVCDLIPGISGGTVAFITGIYFDLITAVKSVSFSRLLNLFGGLVFPKKANRIKAKKAFFEINGKFLLVLFSGIGFAIFSFARLVNLLLLNYFVYTISFFSGLIFASLVLIFKSIEKRGKSQFCFGFFGLITGGLFVILTPFNLQPNYFYIFWAGFLAVNAMFLPGISGAFILVVLGVYEFMIAALVDFSRNLEVFAFFLLGALLGAFTISRLISFFFKKAKDKTLYFLSGLVLGSLVVPLKKISDAFSCSDSKVVVVSCFLLGSFIFVLFELLKKIKKPAGFNQS